MPTTGSLAQRALGAAKIMHKKTAKSRARRKALGAAAAARKVKSKSLPKPKTGGKVEDKASHIWSAERYRKGQEKK